MSRHPVRSNRNFRRLFFLIKNALVEEDKERSPQPKGFYLANVKKFFEDNHST